MSSTRRQVIFRGSRSGIVMIDRIVHHGGQEIVSALHGMEVVGEMEIDVVHRMDRESLRPWRRPSCRKQGPGTAPKRCNGGLSQFGEGLGEPDGDGGFPLAGRRGVMAETRIREASRRR